MAKLLKHFGFKKSNNANNILSPGSVNGRNGVEEAGGGVVCVNKISRSFCDGAAAVRYGQQVVPETASTYTNDDYRSGGGNMKRQNAVRLKVYGRNDNETDAKSVDSTKSVHTQALSSSANLILQISALEDDYSQPADYFYAPPKPRLPSVTRTSPDPPPSCFQPTEDEDYSEPFQAVVAPTLGSVELGASKDEASAYDEVYEFENDEYEDESHPNDLNRTETDDRPGEEYDSPWEWRTIPPPLMPQLGTSTTSCENDKIQRSVSLEEAASATDEDNSCQGSQLSLNMSGRPRRHIYETAFDSSIKTTDVNDEIINHSILTSSSTTMTIGINNKREGSLRIGQGNISPSPSSSSSSGGKGSPQSSNRVSTSPKGGTPIGATARNEIRQKKCSEHLVRALVHVPPRSANSTPTLSTYRKDGSSTDNSSSCASSAKSTPTHFLSKCTHHHSNLPFRQFSELTLGEPRKETALNSSTASMPPGGTGAVGMRGGQTLVGNDPGLGSSSSGAVSSEESVASSFSSASSRSCSSSSGNNNSASNSHCNVDNCHRPCFDIQRTSSKPLVNRFILQQKLLNSDCVVVDTRPSDDYDPPWDSVGAGLKLQQNSALISSSSSSSSSLTTTTTSSSSPSFKKSPNVSANCSAGGGDSSNNSDASSLTPPLSRTSISDSDEQHRLIDNETPKPFHLECPKRPTLQLSFNKEPTSARPSLRSNLSLDLNLNSPPKLKRKDIILNFGCPMMSTLPDPVDATIPLERQGWYHGAISRTEAENLLRILQEGSYLVRNSESSKNDYSLSLKSARGFMHMKIVFSEGKYILGQFSKPFSSIPEMIHHYSICKLPIKGAEHMSLLHPVIDQLL